MAKNGLLGKDLTIGMTKNGKPFKLETEKFNEKQIQDEQKKHPIGEPHEHVRIVLKGWELDVEGEQTGPELDDLFDEIETAYRANQPIPEINVFTEEVYESGEVRKWKYTGDGGVRISGFEKTGDGGDKARKYKFKLQAQRRERVA